MNTFKLIVSSPDGKQFEKQVVKLSLRGTEGELAIMAGHIPFATAIKPCECRIETQDGSEKICAVESGLLTVTEKETLLLSGNFKWK